jgi:glycosyltransferase involved in cell wall biosynthesis
MLHLLKLSDLIITDNQASKKYLQKRGFATQKISLLPSGINWKKIKNHRPETKQKFDAAYIGRLDLHRGILDLPLIWNKVIQQVPNAKLAIAGYGPQSTTKHLKKQFDRHKLKRKVTFLGYLPHSQNQHHPLYDLLKSIKILLLPIHEGGWPLTIAEALAAGKPIVSYNIPNIKSAFKTGVYTIPFKNTQKFSQKTIQLLSGKINNQQIAEAQQNVKRFDYTTISNQLFNLVLN